MPVVQELAKEALAELPHRYSRLGLEPAANVDPRGQEVPVIDLQRLMSHEFTHYELDKLHAACADWGFFQMVNHEIPDKLLENLKAEVQNFFALPVELKQKFVQLPDDTEGYGQNFVKSEEQKLDWSDMLYMISLPVGVRKPHLIPMLPPTFREAVEAYSSALKSVSRKFVEFVSKTLKIDVKELNELFEEGLQAFRFNYYPPCPQPERALGLTAHSDQVGFTFLLEINDQPGLEIRKDGKWVPVRPLSNAFIVNIGDMLEIVTNGAYRSIEHRAVVNSEKERLSLATFFTTRLDAVIQPASSMVTPENPAKFRSIVTSEFLRAIFAKKLDGKSQLEILKI